MGIHLISVEVCIVSFTVGIVHPECFLLNQMWQYSSLLNQQSETRHVLLHNNVHYLQQHKLHTMKFMSNGLKT